jgi:cyclophilin family peptidyl-prolyl cis-trans isomerase
MHSTISLMPLVAFALTPLFALPAGAGDVADPAVADIDKFIAENGGKIDRAKANWKLQLPKPPQVVFDAGNTYFWIMETNKGTIRIKLLPKVAPMHVSSTIYLARLGFYDGLAFHRVITQFMAQGGCPLGRGNGGPGYKYDGEFDPAVKHTKPGLLSMANAGPGTDGSQFFLTFLATPWLDGKHTIFGEVVDGMDVVKALEAAGSGNGQTREPLSIVKTTIEVAKAQ